MRSARGKACWGTAVLSLLLLLGVAMAAGSAAKETRWAYVENQTGDYIALRFTEVVPGGNKATTGIQVHPGETKRLDATAIDGEVCAWRAKELQPAEKIGCRTLRPGDRWVVR
jgi:hypothetical protein